MSRFFPDYPRPGASATVRQLLNHTSGIASYTAIPGWMTEANTNRSYTTAEMIALFRDLPSPTPPGKQWAYNNSGYVLLGAIVEQVTGRPWYREVERMTGRLGIRTIGYGADRETGSAMVRGYTLADGKVRPALRIHMSVPHGAGGLVGSVGDLARWAQALHHGRVVSPALYTAMTTPRPCPRAEPPLTASDFASRSARRDSIEHGGGIFGFGTESLHSVRRRVRRPFHQQRNHAIDPALVARRLAALAIGQPYREFTRTDVDPAALAPLLGIYRIGESGVTRRFYSRDGRLYTMRDGAPESEVVAAGDDHFFYPANFNWFRMQRRPDGAHVMEMHQGGGDSAELASGPATSRAAPAAEVTRDVLQSYAASTDRGPAAVVALRSDGVLTIQWGASRRSR